MRATGVALDLRRKERGGFLSLLRAAERVAFEQPAHGLLAG